MNIYIAPVPQNVLTGASQLNGKYRRSHFKKPEYSSVVHIKLNKLLK